jgi:hypothetical protein
MRPNNWSGGALALLLALPVVAVSPDRPAQTRPATRPGQTQPAEPRVPELRGLLSTPQNEMRLVAQRYELDRASLGRTYTLAISPTRRARLRQFHRDWLEALGRLDIARLGEDARGEHAKLKEAIEGESRRLEEEARAQAEIIPLAPFAGVVIELEESRRRVDPMDPQKAAGTLTALKKQIDQARTLLQAKPADNSSSVDKALAERAAEATTALRNTLKTWFAFYNEYDPMFTWWVGQTYKEADQALGDYATFLREKPLFMPPSESRGDVPAEVAIKPAGKSPPVPDLNELLALPQSEMRAIVQAYFGTRGGRRGGGDGRRSLSSLQYLKDWLAALQKLDFDALGREGQVDYLLLRNRIESDLRRRQLRDNPPPPLQRIADDSGITGRPIGREALIVELAAEMIPYTPDELIRIAEREFAWCEAELKKASREMGLGDDWKQAVERVKTMYVPPGKQPDLIRDLAWEAIEYVEQNDLVGVPQVARETWRMQMMPPQRQLVNPFFTGGEVISVSYPTAGMSYDAKLQSMRGNNIPFARATVFHELIPGHHLQQFMNSRYRSHRRPLGTSFWGEGWALYWEMLLYDRGFPKTPEHRVGMLFWRSHRCARIVFSLGFHTGKMSPAQCIDYLVQRVGHERDNATAEVRRSFGTGYGPLYQAAYMLGGLQFRELHKELVESGRMSDRQFHDAVLKESSMPVAMVRAVLSGQKLTRDWKADWKFYGANP